MTLKEFRDIALQAAKGTAPETFSMNEVNAAFIDGLKELAGSYNQFMKNRYDIYDIIIESIDEVLPKNVIDALGAFAEVKVVGQGEKAMFRRKLGRQRAKKFLTQVGLSGVYETFRLDSDTFDVSAHAVGGGATIDFERMLDGAESLAEVVGIVTEGLENAVYVEVQKALNAALEVMPATNKVSGSWDPEEMVKLLSVVRAYGAPVIYACPEFVAAMGPDAIVPVLHASDAESNKVAQGIYSPKDIDAIHDYGFINVFRGAPVVQLPQSFVDESNTETYVNPRIAFVMPAGQEKVVKVVLEGATQIRDHENKDNSMEVFAWKKMGCAILTHHNWAMYENTSLTDTSAKDIYGF
jgi:hypothetical protein